jgi:hypothetical protein
MEQRRAGGDSGARKGRDASARQPCRRWLVHGRSAAGVVPERVSEGQALAEVVAFSLRRSLVNSAVFPVTEEYQPTPEFLSGLHLWLAWQGEMPVSSYRRELVGWLYANTPVPAEKLPVAYVEVCEIFNALKATLRHQVVLNTATNAFTAHFDCTVTSSEPFTLNGKTYRLSKPGEPFAITFSGHLNQNGPPSGFMAGFVTGLELQSMGK